KSNIQVERICTERMDTMSKNEQTDSVPVNKQTSTLKKILIPIFIILAFVAGFLISTQMNDTDEEKVIATTKSFVANHFVSYHFIEFQDLGLAFSDINAEEVEKETKNKRGLYKVTGEVEYDETIYSFTANVEVRNGMTFLHDKITVEE